MEAQSLTLFSDVFMTAVLQEPEACQHVLRILTGIKDLTVKSVRTQYRVSKVTSHDAILDILAEDGNGKLFNIEIQRSNTIHHPKRIRFYCSMVDSEFLQKGKSYDEMSDLCIIYISETDLWNYGKTVCPVLKYLGTRNTPYDDGIHILYVNAAARDGSAAAQLMEYFKTADPDDMSQGALSRRVHFLKSEEGGYQIMREISEKWFREGEKEGERNKARQTAFQLKNLGFSPDKIASIVDFSVETVMQWLNAPLSPAEQISE